MSSFGVMRLLGSAMSKSVKPSESGVWYVVCRAWCLLGLLGLLGLPGLPGLLRGLAELPLGAVQRQHGQLVFAGVQREYRGGGCHTGEGARVQGASTRHG